MARKKIKVSISEKNAKKAKKAVKAALKKLPKRKRIIATICILVVLALSTYIVDLKVIGLEYIPTLFKIPDKTMQGENELRVHFLDVGQGDSIILEFPDDTNMIIDGGDNAKDNTNAVIRYARALKIKTFDYMLLTHSDADHVGGLDDIINCFEVKKIYMPYIEDGLYISKNYERFIQAVKDEKAEIDYSNWGDQIINKDDTNNFILAFLSPDDKDTEGGEYDELNDGLKKNSADAHEKNDVSPIMLLDYMDVKLMFTGDASTEVEESVITRFQQYFTSDTMFTTKDNQPYYINLDIDILKVGHHGSDTSSSVEFLDYVKPEYAIISVGENNRYSHPDLEILTRLTGYVNSDGIYRTDLNGDIMVTINPQNSDDKFIINSNNKNATSENNSEAVIKIDIYLNSYSLKRRIA